MSEQRPFDGVSLLFIFPLVVMILRRNGIGYTEAEAIEEQITVTLEFVSFHMGLCKCFATRYSAK